MPPKSMLTPSFIKHAVLLAGSCILLGHSAAHADAPRDHAAKGRSASRPATISSAQFLYQALLGEIAARRGAASTAVASYLDLTRKTHDPRIARRATEIALQYREMALAAEAARGLLSGCVVMNSSKCLKRQIITYLCQLANDR